LFLFKAFDEHEPIIEMDWHIGSREKTLLLSSGGNVFIVDKDRIY